MNDCMEEDSNELLLFYFLDREFLWINPSNFNYDNNIRWLEGNEQSLLCYSNNGKISLKFYINPDLYDMKYSFYINGSFVGEMSSFNEEKAYEFICENKTINSKYFYFTIKCEDSYKPYEHGSQDIRDLLMYFICLDCSSN